MKKRALALLLVLLMALALFAGCKKTETNANADEEEPEGLATGAYEVYDEDEELVAWLKVSKKTITVYDEDGNTTEYDYELDEDSGNYLVDDEEAFYIKERKGDVYLVTAEDEDEYLLTEIDKADLPEAAEAAPDAAAPEAPAEAPAETELPTLSGAYASYEDGELVGYMDVGRSTMRIYELNGSYDDYDYDVSDGFYNVHRGAETLSLLIEETDGELRMTRAGESSYFVLETIRSSDLPTEAAAETPDVWASAETLAYYDGVSLLGDVPGALPQDWQDYVSYYTDDTGAQMALSYEDAYGGTVSVMVTIGNPAELGVSTTEELAAVVRTQYEDTLPAQGVEEGNMLIAGLSWAFMRYPSAGSGIASPASMAVCSTCVSESFMALIVFSYVGSDADVSAATLEQFIVWLDSLEFAS